MDPMEQHESGLSPFYQQPPPQQPNATALHPNASEAITSGVATTIDSPASNGGPFSNHVVASDGANAATALYTQSAVNETPAQPLEIVRKKRGRPRKYGTPEEAAAAKAATSAARSSASFSSPSSSSRKRDHQVIGSPPSTSSSNKKSQLDFEADTGQSFMPHVINVQPGEDVAQKIRTFMQQSKREFCILSASGSVCNVSLLQPATSGGSITCDGPFNILSLSGSFVRTDHGERSGGLSACFSATTGQIVGGGLAGPLIAVDSVEVIVATFLINTKKDSSASAKVDNATASLASPNNVSVTNVGYRPVIEQSGGFAVPDHQNMGGFMMQHQDLHILPSHVDWRAGPDTRNGLNYDFTVSENQFGFMPGRSTLEAIHLLRRLIETYRERRSLHMVFVDLEKAYDRVPRRLLWECLETKGLSGSYIRVLKDMYAGALTSICTPSGDTEYFPVQVGLHQGSALSPFLFAVMMDVLSGAIQGDVPWCMLFADDIVLVDESREGVNNKLESWRERLESKGFKLSRTKTEYMEFGFGGSTEGTVGVRIGDCMVPQKESFKYLGSYLQKDGGIDADITHRIQAGWAKWRGASGVLCDRKIPLELKGKVYRVVVRPAMLYGAECWPLTKIQEQRLVVAEMRMLRWMCGLTRMDRIRNVDIRSQVGVAAITDKLRESRLRWLGHVLRRQPDAPVRRCEGLAIANSRRSRGRPKKSWREVIRRDLDSLNLTEDMALDRAIWRERTRAPDGG